MYRPTVGGIAFVALVAAFSGGAAVLARLSSSLDASWELDLFHATIVYVALLGWQPLVAFLLVRRFVDSDPLFDLGLHEMRFRYWLVAVISPVFLVGASTGLRFAFALSPSEARYLPVSSALVLVWVVPLLWLQAVAEEVGWRGYVLGRLMRTLGAWPGLFAHALLWGFCHAPMFWLSDDASWCRFGEFLVTCVLLGSLLGWLRLASNSIWVTAAANAILTIGAGLPLMLSGVSSPRSALYEPSGWIPLAVALTAVVIFEPLRALVVTSRAEGPGGGN